MIPNRTIKLRHMVSAKVAIIFLLFLSSTTLNAQTPTNYSGKWQFNRTKSILDKIEPDYDGTIILEIVQNSDSITFGEIYIRPGSPDWKTATESYNLNGKEKITKSGVGTNKNSATWSEDKKVLTITNTDTQKLKGVLQDFFVRDSYILSDDGLTLTIERYQKNPVTGETKVKKVYSKQ